MKTLSFSATGDSFVVRKRNLASHEFIELATFLKTTDVRFTNLETLLRDGEGFPSAQSGGTWASSSPEVLKDLKAYGFNLFAWANNHTLDYSYGALESTKKYLDEAEVVHAGVGKNREEASAARYLDTPNGRIALIAATSTFHESWIAGAARSGGSGRPGVNGLQFHTVHRVRSEHLDSLRKIAETCYINAAHNTSVQEGFTVADAPDVVRVGSMLFKDAKGYKEGQETIPHQGDLNRLLNKIKEVKSRADAVLVSIHAHEAKQPNKDQPADFLVTASRACIDAGAHAVIGHGPHILRGIEVYHGKPIFYSLGNFIFQNESIEWLPTDFYEKYGIPDSATTQEALVVRTANGTKGFSVNPKVWHTVVPQWKMTGAHLDELILYPVQLGWKTGEDIGTPRLTTDLTALEEVMGLSHPFGTKFRIEKHKAIWVS